MNLNYQQRKEEELEYSESNLNKVLKRGFDVVFSVIALILSSPVLLAVALLIKMEDRGPVLFKQARAGRNGVAFKIYKFRSMKVTKGTAKKSESPYNWTGRVPDDFVFKITDNFNPNVTKVGRFIRKYSLDELPQFFNVLKGEMSVVGPRPEIVEITSCYDEQQSQRLLVKPGVTGWAQINGRSDMNHGKKVALDLEYVSKSSFLLDVKIIFMTVWQVVFGRGSV